MRLLPETCEKLLFARRGSNASMGASSGVVMSLAMLSRLSWIPAPATKYNQALTDENP